jgi:hypothetical protein
VAAEYTADLLFPLLTKLCMHRFCCSKHTHDLALAFVKAVLDTKEARQIDPNALFALARMLLLVRAMTNPGAGLHTIQGTHGHNPLLSYFREDALACLIYCAFNLTHPLLSSYIYLRVLAWVNVISGSLTYEIQITERSDQLLRRAPAIATTSPMYI